MPTPTTRWSLIAAARGPGAPARAALEALCQDYRPVVLSYFRRQDRQGLAEDHTQAFFLHFLEHHLQARADRERGSFRSFLYAALQNHWLETLRHAAAKKRFAGISEGSEVLDALPDPGPDLQQAFDRDWALTVLRRAREQLRAEAERSGRMQLFDAVQEFLLEPPAESDYATIALRLGMPANSVAVAVKRLRERLRERARKELADTLPPDADLEEEMRWLKQALRGD